MTTRHIDSIHRLVRTVLEVNDWWYRNRQREGSLLAVYKAPFRVWKVFEIMHRFSSRSFELCFSFVLCDRDIIR